MLKDNFFTIKEYKNDGNGNFHFIVCLNSKHKIYEGHFPQMPVVPGVCTIQMVKECLQTIRNKELQYEDIINCKFPGMIVPSSVQDLDININVTESEQGTMIKASVKNDEHNFLSIKAFLKEEA